jgi:hypothetical protein
MRELAESYIPVEAPQTTASWRAPPYLQFSEAVARLRDPNAVNLAGGAYGPCPAGASKPPAWPTGFSCGFFNRGLSSEKRFVPEELV